MSEMENQNAIYQNRIGMEFYNSKRENVYRRFDEFVDIVFVKRKQIDWKKSVEVKKLVPSGSDFKELLGENGKEVYKPLLEVKKTKDKEVVKWMSEYLSSKDENGWGQDKTKNKWTDVVKKSPELKNLLNHLMYIWSLGPYMKTRLYDNDVDQSEEIFPKEGLWSGGTALSQKPNDFYAFVLLAKKILNESNEVTNTNVRKAIINFFNTDYNDKNPNIKNAFLHFCNPAAYAPVAASATKESIKKNLSFVLNQDEIPSSLDECILAIHQKLRGIQIAKGRTVDGCIFWPDYGTFINGKDDGVSDYSTLKFKKAVVLYGPPGTSKTYSASEIAKAIFFENAVEKKESDVPSFVKKLEKSNIHRLQLHPNYSYEDFVWGYEISTKESDGQISSISKPKKGYILNLLEKISRDENDPHVLILDEINRVDLSRLFGELFSAIENRNENVELPVSFDGSSENYKICIPSNLYIIGTMNEIDFSLERIDFALRRRFAWIFKGYDDGVLGDIIKKRLENANIDKINIDDYQDYVNECTRLNNKISKDLGKQYQIGHTIFAEIVGVQKDMCFDDFSLKTIKQAKKILWNISVKPLLEAYLGNVDQEKINELISDYEISYGLKRRRKGKNGEDIVVDEGENGEDS